MVSYFGNSLVSVIIPVYNSEKFIFKTIDSVMNQNFKNIEIIIIDDGSTDNTKRMVQNFIKNKSNNIIYYRFEINSGVSAARNKGLELAKGRYIAFLDSDDIWYSQKILKQLELMNQRNAGICFTAIEIIDEKDNVIKRKRKVLDKVDYHYLLKNTIIATSSIVIDRNIVGNFKMPLIKCGAEDYATWLAIMRKGTIAYGLDEVLVKYRKSRHSLSSNKIKSLKQVWQVQRYNENIHPIKAAYNSTCFAINAFKKYFL